MIAKFGKTGLAALGIAAMTPAVYAATATTNLTVTATVVDTCVVSATAIGFASINSSGATNEVTPGSIVLNCTADKSGVTVALNGGLNAAGATRRMTDGQNNYVPYDLHSDSGHNTAVPVNGNIYNGNVSAATPATIDVYGQVPAGAYIAGGYSDTVLITVTY